MKIFACLLFALFLLGFSIHANGQVSNLEVNGSTTSFTMTSGDTVHWEYSINPPGATVHGELWYDVNGNGDIDTTIDKPRYIFTQTDGDTNGNGGPPDMDGLVNGHVLFKQHLGLAPGNYIFKLTYSSSNQSVTGTCLALSSPAHTISGTVTPPAGKSAQYIFVQANRNGNYDPNFWEAVTDASGNYTIEMTSDTAGNPWTIQFSDNYNPYPPSVVIPVDTPLTISDPTYTGFNFSFLTAAAQVTGYVKDENNNPLLNRSVSLRRNDGGVNLQSNKSGSGSFQIGLQLSDLNGQTWLLQSDCNCNNGVTGSELIAQVSLPAITAGDSLYRVLTIYNANSQIQGQIQVNGSPPGFPIQLMAQVTDTAQAQTWSDSATGNFTFNVTTKLYNYAIIAPSWGIGYNNPNVIAHAGQSDVIVNFTTTSVRERGPGIPDHFSLHQNYPNPFNPTTKIEYDLPKSTHVRLSIVNLLGNELIRLVDAEQHAGIYSAPFDASKLPSGIYFYRLEAGEFSSVKKMLLMK